MWPSVKDRTAVRCDLVACGSKKANLAPAPVVGPSLRRWRATDFSGSLIGTPRCGLGDSCDNRAVRNQPQLVRVRLGGRAHAREGPSFIELLIGLLANKPSRPEVRTAMRIAAHLAPLRACCKHRLSAKPAPSTLTRSTRAWRML